MHSLLAVNFQNTLTLGWLIVAIMLAVMGGYFAVRDRSVKRWRELYDLADTERKEIQQQRDECAQTLTDARITIEKLDALQMPIRIVELMNESVHRIDEQARVRLSEALEALRSDTNRRDSRDEERHAELMGIMHELRGALSRVGRGNGPAQA